MKIYAAFGKVTNDEKERALCFIEILDNEEVDVCSTFDPLNRASVIREAYFHNINRDNRGTMKQVDIDKPMMLSIIDKALKEEYNLRDISLFKADFFGESVEDPKIDLGNLIENINEKFSIQEIYEQICREGEVIEVYSITLGKDESEITIYLNGLLKTKNTSDQTLFSIEDIVEEVFVQKRAYIKELFNEN